MFRPQILAVSLIPFLIHQHIQTSTPRSIQNHGAYFDRLDDLENGAIAEGMLLAETIMAPIANSEHDFRQFPSVITSSMASYWYTIVPNQD
jgi:hypothetical protein